MYFVQGRTSKSPAYSRTFKVVLACLEHILEQGQGRTSKSPAYSNKVPCESRHVRMETR